MIVITIERVKHYGQISLRQFILPLGIYFQASTFMTAVNAYTTSGQCTYSASGTYSSCPSNALFPCQAYTCMNADIVAIGSVCSKRRKREALLPDLSLKGKKK